MRGQKDLLSEDGRARQSAGQQERIRQTEQSYNSPRIEAFLGSIPRALEIHPGFKLATATGGYNFIEQVFEAKENLAKS
jgi:hypothetical protein